MKKQEKDCTGSSQDQIVFKVFCYHTLLKEYILKCIIHNIVAMVALLFSDLFLTACSLISHSACVFILFLN